MEFNIGTAFVSFIILISVFIVHGANQPNVTVFPKEPSILNEGDNYTIYCNFPGIETLDMVNSFPPEWFKGDKRLSYLSSIDNDLKDARFKVEVKTEGNQRNLTAILDIVGVKASDEGQYKCKVKDREDTTMLKIRRPIQTMKLTLINKGSKQSMETTGENKVITIDPGRYTPTCEASGSFPEPVFQVALGGDRLQGQEITLQGKDGVQFVADDVELSNNDDGSTLVCKASVPDLRPMQSMQKSFKLKVNLITPTIQCDNSSAMSGNRRHKLTCRISNVKNIECENIIWERLDTSEQFRIEKVNPGYAFKCEENSADNSATVELEILEVKEEHFKVEWAVMYQLGEGLFSQREITTIQQLNAASSLYGLASMILSVAAVVFLL